MESPTQLYEPLDSSKEEIRILFHIPGKTHSDSLRFLLERVSFKSRGSMTETAKSLRTDSTPRPSQYRFEWGDYAALSYVWGIAPETEVILVNGNELKIRPNLAAALKQIAKSSRFEGKYGLWADALCINQHDLAERGQQVSMMKVIYGMAWNVISWIGEEADESFKAMQIIRVLSQHKEKEKAYELIQTLRKSPEYFGKGAWIALDKLCIRPYWTRVWIIQELVMGCTAVSIWCGDVAFDWTTFIHGIEALHLHFWPMKDELLDHDWKQRGDFSGHAFHGRALHLLKKDIMIMIENRANDPEAWTSLSRLLDISATCNVTDIRDKAYGMLAMMDPAVAIHISPDYTMSAKEVFTNVAITAFKVYENLELLNGIGGRRNTLLKYIENTVIQPDNLTSAYGDYESTKQALAHALCGDATYKREYLAARMMILYHPATYQEGLPQWQELGWDRFESHQEYYYMYSDWRQCNRNLLIGGRVLREYFEPKIPIDASEVFSEDALSSFENMQTGRRLATTCKGYIGWVPELIGAREIFQVAKGDIVAIIFGCTTPILLRKYGDCFRVIGEAYFMGYMSGEVMQMFRQGKCEPSLIELI